MGHLQQDRPAISVAVEIRAELLVVVSTAEVIRPDGAPGNLMARDILSPFTPIRSAPGQTVPVSMDKRLALIYSQIVADQAVAINRSIDFIDEHGFLAFDMATGRVTA